MSAAVAPTGTDSWGRFGQDEQRLLALVLDGVELHAELPDLLGALTVPLLDRPGVEPLALGLGNLVARGVLLALQPLEVADQAPTEPFERRDFLQCPVGIHSTAAQTGSHDLQVFTDKLGIEHATSGTHCSGAPE